MERMGRLPLGGSTSPHAIAPATARRANVGREALAHCLFQGAGITGVRNPLAAAGGVDPETMQHIVQVAPFAFQSRYVLRHRGRLRRNGRDIAGCERSARNDPLDRLLVLGLCEHRSHSRRDRPHRRGREAA